MYVTAGKDIIALEPETAKVIWKLHGAGRGEPAAASPTGPAIATRRLDCSAARAIAWSPSMRSAVSRSAGFGEDGSVDLKASVRGDVDGGFSLTSPPSVYKNIIITGGNNGEQSPSFGLYGDIRGWDARTGKLLWSFHTVPRAGEPGVETWEGESWKNRSGTNVWSFFTIDTERGIVYAPLGSPTSDYYGGDRKGANLYGNSIVALDATTGDAEVAPAARASRSVGLRHAGRADARRRQAQRPHDSRGRRDDEDGPGVHLRSRHRRADLRHRRAAGAAEQRAGRGHLADAAVSREAGAAGAQHVRSGEGLLRADARARRLLQGAVGHQRDVHQGPVHAARRRGHDGDASRARSAAATGTASRTTRRSAWRSPA